MPYRIKSPITRRKIGRRGACLLIFGFVPAMVGASLYVQPYGPGNHRRTVPLLAKMAPDNFWALVWVCLGTLAMACAFGTWRATRVGYVLAYSLPFLWAAANFISWAVGWLPTGWIASFIYLGYCLLVVIISGWDEPNEPLNLGRDTAEAGTRE